MTKIEKLSLIELYESQSAQVKAWAALPVNTLDYRPSEDRWTIREHIIHLLDADINGISRARKAIAEPGAPIYPYEEELWTARLAYGQTDLQLTVDLVEGLRRFMGQTCRAILEQDWTQLAYLHPKNGLINLEQYLQHYIDHVEFHKEYIDGLREINRR